VGGVEISLAKPPPPPPAPPLPPPTSTCIGAKIGEDAVCGGDGSLSTCVRVGSGSVGNQTQASCCALCDATDGCGTWVLSTKAEHGPAAGTCFLLARGTVTATKASAGRTLGGAVGAAPTPAPATGLRAPGVLQASSAAGGWHWRAWDTATDEVRNLKGTLAGTPSADLAGCCTNPNASAGQYDSSPHYVLQNGLLSRGGATAIDDSSGVLYDIDPASGGLDDAWLSNLTATPAVEGREDLYVFACGTDYRGCLADFVSVSGPMALPPLSGLGVWWSRHWGNPHNIEWGGAYFGAMTEENSERAFPDTLPAVRIHTVDMHMAYLTGKGAWKRSTSYEQGRRTVPAVPSRS
jgi:hypothetical protein